MKKSILCLLVTTSLSVFATEKEAAVIHKTFNGKIESSDMYTCLPGVSIPNELVSSWERDFEIDGAIGKEIISFLPNCEFDLVQIGDYVIMEEWYEPLDPTKVYKFKSTPLQKITAVNNQEFYLDDSTGTGEIIDFGTGEKIATWDISSWGGYVAYDVHDDSLTLTYTYSNYTFKDSYSRVKP
ncbi:hypothetical protein BCU36_017245 [Vibrio lentus]|uniref:hypothetical protein n=1 Tax=Vibrio lentus TaxID=136468 RepID=UPI000C8194BD|nr:hypothetical protein [Vibrio lentus]PMI80485.1 hypothetical protein BCU36_16215 [Vibrio lentus]